MLTDPVEDSLPLREHAEWRLKRAPLLPQLRSQLRTAQHQLLLPLKKIVLSHGDDRVAVRRGLSATPRR